MGFTAWLCLLCLQASVLSHALDCSGGSLADLCVNTQTADEQTGDRGLQQPILASVEQVPLRPKRRVERRSHARPGHSSLPGAFSVKGFPKSLIQADRSRRHLAQAANKKKNKRKSRVGSFSLLSNDKKSNPLQVIRARRQVKNQQPKYAKSGHTGTFSVLGNPQNGRPKRSLRPITA
ncbi:uncharacterized protein si:dkey-12l12.1 [Hippocampus zosterae]|uniref:uncharacterized protein si:dkey-12l12.1 n=1 Tax=Hippocampus zosterae TaxID=109293 RepID=UPI00223E58B1|nr:uncharacterized protein si:dkey-12l12.1 [Hippocampus zosterae]